MLLHLLDGTDLGRALDVEGALTWRRPMWPTGTGADLECVLDSRQAVDAGLARGSHLVIREDILSGSTDLPVYRVDLPQWDTDGAGTVQVTARSLAKVIGARGIVPAGSTVSFGGSMHDAQTTEPAESALKHYWTAYAASGAPAARQWPDLTIEPDQSRGGDVTIAARGQTLGEVSEQAGVRGGIGWEVVYRLADGDFHLRAIVGTDRSADVILAVADNPTATRIQWQPDELGPNVAYVFGQGEGTARELAVAWLGATEPTGADRREIVVDARDITGSAALQARGLAKLREDESTDRLLIDVHAFGSMRYGTDYSRGDIVAARHAPWGLSTTQRIVGVEHVADAGLVTSVEVGWPWPRIDTLTDDTQTFE